MNSMKQTKSTDEIYSKIEEMKKDIMEQEIQPRKMTAMKFVGVAFDPEKYKAGEAEINEALSDGFEVMRDFETGGGIVMCMAKWEKKIKEEKK